MVNDVELACLLSSQGDSEERSGRVAGRELSVSKLPSVVLVPLPFLLCPDMLCPDVLPFLPCPVFPFSLLLEFEFGCHVMFDGVVGREPDTDMG